MAKFTGEVSDFLERRDGRWFFSIRNLESNAGIECISSVLYEVENQSVPLELHPGDEVEVIGDVRMPGTYFFDYVKVLKKAEQAEATK